MAEQIEVVDIKEDKQEEAPESKDEQVPEFNEVAENVLQEEELKVIKEETQSDVSETKPKTKANNANSALKEKTACPDCGISLTMHGLKYTHKRYCKAKPATPAPPPSPPSPPGLVRQKTAIEKVESLQALVPTPEQTSAYLAQERKMKAEKKRSRMNNLITQAF